MAVKVGINGFGRIGRNIMRAAMGNADIDFVAVNDLTNAATLAHLLKYDSILGNLQEEVVASGDGIRVGRDEFKVLSVKDPAQLPWKDLGVDVVFESTGLFATRDASSKSKALRRSRWSARSRMRFALTPTQTRCVSWASHRTTSRTPFVRRT